MAIGVGLVRMMSHELSIICPKLTTHAPFSVQLCEDEFDSSVGYFRDICVDELFRIDDFVSKCAQYVRKCFQRQQPPRYQMVSQSLHNSKFIDDIRLKCS